MLKTLYKTLVAALVVVAAGCGGQSPEDICLAACRKSVSCYGGAFADCTTTFNCARVMQPERCKNLLPYEQCVSACTQQSPCSDFSSCVLNCPDPKC